MSEFKEKLENILGEFGAKIFRECDPQESVTMDFKSPAKEIMQLIHDDCRKEANEESTMYHPYEERFVQAFQKRLKECGGIV